MLTLGNAREKHSKAVGTIVGAAFFLMILFTGYMFYMLSNQVTNAQQQSIVQMNDFDLEHSQENVTCGVPNWTQDNLELTIKNAGPRLVNVIAVGFYYGGTWTYDNTIITVKDGSNWVPFNTVQLSPWESYSIRVTKTGIVESPTSPYLIQFLTEKGTIKVVGYP